MYECWECGAILHHLDAPCVEFDGHLYCPECAVGMEEEANVVSEVV